MKLFEWLSGKIGTVRIWMNDHGIWAKILGTFVLVLLTIIAVLVVAVCIMWDKKRIPEKDPAPEIDKEAQDAHDAEAARVAALPAADVVDGLPNSGEVRGEIDKGRGRIHDLFQRARTGRDGGGG
jgi:Na+-transporting methylmalonyl-CoA/oxaloacetate decarboxylase gamma subunit